MATLSTPTWNRHTSTLTYSVSSTNDKTTLTLTKVVTSATTSQTSEFDVQVIADGAVLYDFTIQHAAGSYTYTKTVTKSWSRGTSAASKSLKIQIGEKPFNDWHANSTTISVPAKPSYTVSYNANGGSGAPGNQTKWYGTNLTLSSTKPTRTNYVFKNWNTAANGSGTTYNSGGTYSGNAALTLYAQWYAPYTISYNANGGSGAPGNQTKIYNTNLTLSSTKPTRTNYVFKNWNTKQDGTGTAYSPGSSYTANAAATLYAQWYDPYTVTFNDNGGSGGPGSQTKIYNTNLTLSSTKPTRTNYVFKNWNTKQDGTGTVYNPGETYSTNAALALYAQWYPPYTVTYNANGGSGTVNEQAKIYNTALTLRNNAFTRIEHAYIDSQMIDMVYQFVKWNTESNGTGTSYDEGASYTQNADMTLYAIWKQLPVIKSDCYRINDLGEADDTGSNLQLVVKWIADQVDGTTGSTATVTINGKTRIIDIVELIGQETSGTINIPITDLELVPNQNYELSVTITDSDGRSNTVTQQMTTNYSAPVITSASIDRCDEDGDISDNGTYAKVTLNWQVANIGSQTKPVSVEAVAKHNQLIVAQASTTEFDGTVSDNIVYGTTMLLLGSGETFDTDKIYYVDVTLNDVANSFTAGLIIQVAYFPFDVLAGGHGAAFGKPARIAELLDVGYSVNADNGYKLNGEDCYPIIVRDTWSTSADATTLPLKPCFIFSLSDNFIYYCNASGTTVKVN